MSVRKYLVFKNKKWILTIVSNDSRLVYENSDLSSLMHIASRKEVKICAKN